MKFTLARKRPLLNWQDQLSLLFLGCCMFGQRATAFVVRSSEFRAATRIATAQFLAASTKDEQEVDFFKAGLLANVQEEAAIIASQKIKSVKDLGWKQQQPPKRIATIRPKYWAWGGADEVAIQNKANYDINNKNAPETWLSLADFYALVNDNTAVADTIFVALAGGRAFIERNVAEQILEQWWETPNGRKRSFNKSAFFQTVRAGQQDYLVSWGTFFGITGYAVLGIAFPTNPLQLALVNALETVTKKVT